MNRTLKEATIKRFHYETTDQLNADFISVYMIATVRKPFFGIGFCNPAAGLRQGLA
ncbi:MAG: hypothetical protein ACRYFX_15790 [Janthinobacterium lividum]